MGKLKLSDLFDIEYGQKEYENKGALIESVVGTPLISSKGTNKGVFGYFDIKPKYENVISVPRVGTICEAHYQKIPCCIDNNCLVLKPKIKLNSIFMLFYTKLIRVEKYKYMYGRQVTPDRLGNTLVPNLLDAFYVMCSYGFLRTHNDDTIRYDTIRSIQSCWKKVSQWLSWETYSTLKRVVVNLMISLKTQTAILRMLQLQV